MQASLREGGGFCEAKDGRSLRDGGFEQASCQRFFDLLFIVNEKEKGGVLGNDIVFEESFISDFIAYFLFFFFPRKEESERK